LKTLFKILRYTFVLIILISALYYFLPEKELPKDSRIDKIIIIKHKHKMYVYSKGKLLKTYRIALGRVSGKKRFEGDKKTPEGNYFIDSKNPHSNFYLNLGISYPNGEDIAYAKKHKKNPGGLIKIHGLKNGLGFIGKFQRFFNWTRGCIAVTNQEIEEIYKSTPIGTPIIIKP